MGTTRAELKRKVLMGFKDLTGEDILMCEEALNMACRAIAEVHNFEELKTYDTTSADTVDGTKTYHLTTDLSLTRPKDIVSIIVHDDHNSRKLKYRDPQWVDANYPYPEGMAETLPEIYTQRGNSIDLIPIPDDAYDLYITYYQWPAEMTADTTECSYSNIDTTIIALARDIFISLRAGLPLDYADRARGYLGISYKDDRSMPDRLPVARPFNASKPITGEYWNDPFIHSVK